MMSINPTIYWILEIVHLSLEFRHWVLGYFLLLYSILPCASVRDDSENHRFREITEYSAYLFPYPLVKVCMTVVKFSYLLFHSDETKKLD